VLQPDLRQHRLPAGRPRGDHPPGQHAHRADEKHHHRLGDRCGGGLAADEGHHREPRQHALRGGRHLRPGLHHPDAAPGPGPRPSLRPDGGEEIMSVRATVLYDAPGPRGRRNNIIFTILTAVFTVLVAGWIIWTLNENGQLTAAKWTPFLDSLTWRTYIL